ncbi:MAG: hypothetical protein COC19_06855 [SAR86 cluster bacterium]|uniref:Peptidase S9 prolyl oligopeptidase catalytic domain-containing protein n=1 Tax=SAR86 cluster bacterium TaxID=2030880 RepID=A0A2A4MIP8_9GAMM|nr:MAG: hypothetical protein COC19_06855 [SAR86 cluster bacterium]
MEITQMLIKPILQIILTLSLSISNSLASEAPNSAQDFFERGSIKAIKISPDGTHLAISFSGEERGRLAIIKSDGGDTVAQFAGKKNQEINDFFWANDERILFNTVVFQGGIDMPFTTGEIYAFNIDNTRKFQLTGYGVGDSGYFYISDMLKDNNDEIRVVRKMVRRQTLSRSRPTSYILDIYGKPRSSGTYLQGNLHQRVTGPLRWGDLYSDNAGQVRVAIANGEDNNTQVSYREGRNGDWRDISNNFSLGKDAEELTLEFVGFSADNRSFYLLNSGEYGTRSLLRYFPETDTSEFVYQHPNFDIQLRDIVFSNDGDSIIGVKLIGDYLENYYFGDHIDIELHRSLDASFPGELVRISNITATGKTAVVSVYGPQRLGDFYLLDVENLSLEALGGNSDKLNPQVMADVAAFAFRGKDDLIIHGYITTPVDAGENLPMIVIPHGGPIGVRDYPQFDREAQYFAQHGYAVLQVNFRGSGGYGNAFEQAGMRQWGTGMIDDISRARRWAVGKNIADTDRICIYGASYGGYAALRSVIHEPDSYQCVIGYAGVYDLNKMNRSDIPFHPGGDSYLARTLGDDEQELRELSPVYHADKITVPVFLAHGGQDRRVPDFHAKDLRKALAENGMEAEWLLKRGEGHGFYDTDNRVEFYEKALSFFDRHIGD